MGVAATPDVSVVIPTFNRLWALPRAIESCRENACTTQIVVVDDGSTDGTWEWLSEQPDILAIRTRNWGKCWAVNTGAASATGRYVRFLDSDDWLTPGANDRQFAAAQACDADLVLAGHQYVTEEGEVLGRRMPAPTSDFLTSYVRQVWTATEITYCACLIRRSLASAIPHRAEYAWHDVLLLLELALTEPVIARTDFVALNVREHSRDDRISDPQGLDQALAIHSTVAMGRKILAAVREKRGPDSATQKALLDGMWIEARKLARFDAREAAAVARWVLAQDPRFEPPTHRALRIAYNVLGFSLSERLVGGPAALRRLFTG